LDFEGELFEIKRQLTYIGSGIEHFEGFDLQDLNIKALQKNEIVKYAAGRSLKAFLNSEGQLFHSRVSNRGYDWSRVFAPVYSNETSVKDFVIVSKLNLGVFNQDSEAVGPEEAVQKCKLVSVHKDPWLNRWIGVSAQDEFVIFQNEKCETVFKNVERISIQGHDIKNTGTGFRELELVVKFKDGSSKTVEGFGAGPQID